MSDWLSAEGFVVATENSLKKAKQVLQKGGEFDLILCDMRLDDGDGMELLKVARRHQPQVPFLMMSGYASPDTGAEVVAAGGFDLLTKPIIDQEMLHSLQRALSQKQVTEENVRLKAELDRRFGMENILSHDLRMQRIFDTIDSVADARRRS